MFKYRRLKDLSRTVCGQMRTAIASDDMSIARPMAVDPLMATTVTSIRSWMHTCLQNEYRDHTICSLSAAAFLPSRLIEIEEHRREFHLRLICGKFLKEDAKYTALSYY
ncbi:hypothetical protein ACHAP5_009989 [Fusarium lateritium]